MDDSSRQGLVEQCLLPSWQQAGPHWAAWGGGGDVGPELLGEWLQHCTPSSIVDAERLRGLVECSPWRVTHSHAASNATLVVGLQVMGTHWELRVRRVHGVEVRRVTDRHVSAADPAPSGWQA